MGLFLSILWVFVILDFKLMSLLNLKYERFFTHVMDYEYEIMKNMKVM